MIHKYIFGPVPSRRLGRSLGIDLLPDKICTLDCVYCECGPTRVKTLKRAEYVPTEAVLAELDETLAGHPELDSITFSGSGEPTLHVHLGKIIEYIKENHPQYVVTVLTNGTLCHLEEVRRELAFADRIVPSLDAVSQEIFQRVNLAHPELDNALIIEGLVALRNMYEGQIWLEIFIVPGINDTETELALFVEAVSRIRPDRVQINSLDRPSAYPGVTVPDPARLEKIADHFQNAEIISRQFVSIPTNTVPRHHTEAILGILKRRPLTLSDIQQEFQLHVHEAHKIMQHLVESRQVEEKDSFYRLIPDGRIS